MDGARTLDELWSDAAVQMGELAPTQDQVIRLVGQLHGSDLLAGNLPLDLSELFVRHAKNNRGKLLQLIMNPLALRIRLLDPDDFLYRTLPCVQPLIGRPGAAPWLATVLPALLLAARYWPELTENIADRVFPPSNLLLMALLYPVVKLLHELGHGYTTRAHGGEVREPGIMLLVLIPMP